MAYTWKWKWSLPLSKWDDPSNKTVFSERLFNSCVKPRLWDTLHAAETKWHWSPHVRWTRQGHPVFWQCSASCQTCRSFLQGQTEWVTRIETGGHVYVNTMYSICLCIYIYYIVLIYWYIMYVDVGVANIISSPSFGWVSLIAKQLLFAILHTEFV